MCIYNGKRWAQGTEGGWLEGGGIFKRGSSYYYMAGSGCCYCAGGGGAMVFISPHPLGPWTFQTNVNDGLYLPFSPRGPPPPPPPVPAGATASCADLSGEWALSVITQNYQPLRAGLTVTKIPPPPPGPPPGLRVEMENCGAPGPAQTWAVTSVGAGLSTISSGSGAKYCLADASAMTVAPAAMRTLGAKESSPRNDLVALVPCVAGAKEQLWQVNGTGAVRFVSERTGLCLDAAYGKPGRIVYLETCQDISMPIGQTWHVSAQHAIVNVAAKTCMHAEGSGAPVPPLDYYNMTSTMETHWPSVPASGWLLAVDKTAKTVQVGGGAHLLLPWLNPHANGQNLPPAPDCTMVTSLAK